MVVRAAEMLPRAGTHPIQRQQPLSRTDGWSNQCRLEIPSLYGP